MISKIWLFLTGILAVTAAYLRDRLQAAKIKELKRDKAEDKAAYDAFKRADKALAKGIADENNADTDSHNFNQ